MSIYFLLIAIITNAPLHAMTDDDAAAYAPKGTLLKSQEENQNLKARNGRSKKLNIHGNKTEKQAEKGKKLKDVSSTSTPPKSSHDLRLLKIKLLIVKFNNYGFNPEVLKLYFRFSHSFLRLVKTNPQYDALFTSKSRNRISKELFLAALQNPKMKEESLLIKESARLGAVDAYTYLENYTVDPHCLHVEGLVMGTSGFKQDFKQAFEVMRTYGVVKGHEGVRKRHLVMLHNFARNERPNYPSADMVKIFREMLLKYVEQKSEVATKLYRYLLRDKSCLFEELTNAELIKADLQEWVQENRSLFLPNNKSLIQLNIKNGNKGAQYAHIESVFKGKNDFEPNLQEAYRLSVRYGIFLKSSTSVNYQRYPTPYTL